MSWKRLAVLAAVAYLLKTQYPDLRRYLKMKGM